LPTLVGGEATFSYAPLRRKVRIAADGKVDPAEPIS
jgi:hypothetical protein